MSTTVRTRILKFVTWSELKVTADGIYGASPDFIRLGNLIELQTANAPPGTEVELAGQYFANSDSTLVLRVEPDPIRSLFLRSSFAVKPCQRRASPRRSTPGSRGGRHRARIHRHHHDDLLSLVAMRNRVYDPPSRRVLL